MRLFYDNGATQSPYGSTRVPPDGNIFNAKIFPCEFLRNRVIFRHPQSYHPNVLVILIVTYCKSINKR